MSKNKVLIVTQEMQPYTALSDMSTITRTLAQYIQDNGMEIRVLMPRFGTINERRHRLHEVVRLSGMNIIVNDDDFPLIIKVASLPEARMQVYFLDNEDFFKRKSVFSDEEGEPFEDNADRMVFFCKGVIETVKKFGWSPDIVHCHGWMTSLIPLYLKTAYKTDPLFQNAKIVYSIYADDLEKTADDNFLAKASINNVSSDDLISYQNGSGVTLHRGAISYSDAVIQGSETLSESVQNELAEADKPLLPFVKEDYLQAYVEFYNVLLEEKVSE
ncbi:MAG: glycogen/starch synthase [Saprospiraceae bacterium]|nr:glycogen/starch synthase [Saprospiraceae bacterium]